MSQQMETEEKEQVKRIAEAVSELPANMQERVYGIIIGVGLKATEAK